MSLTLTFIIEPKIPQSEDWGIFIALKLRITRRSR